MPLPHQIFGMRTKVSLSTIRRKIQILFYPFLLSSRQGGIQVGIFFKKRVGSLSDHRMSTFSFVLITKSEGNVTLNDFQRYDLQRCRVENCSSVTYHCEDWLT